MPFMAETIYRNLVTSVDEDAPISVHLAEWPKVDEKLINENLNRDMTLVMKRASLGHSARNKSNIKVRQPLSEAAFAVGKAEEGETGMESCYQNFDFIAILRRRGFSILTLSPFLFFCATMVFIRGLLLR